MYLLGAIASSTFLVYCVSMAPKQTDPQFKLRMTPEIKEAIEAAAKANNRSMNAEILSRLSDSLGKSTTSEVMIALYNIRKSTEALKEQLDKIKRSKNRE